LVKAKHGTQKCCVNYHLQVFHVIFSNLFECAAKLPLFGFCKSDQHYFDTFENKHELVVQNFNPVV